MCDVKKEIKERARLTRVLANALTYDADYLFSDAETYDLVCINESIKDAKETIQKLVDNIKEIEYLLYLIRSGESQ